MKISKEIEKIFRNNDPAEFTQFKYDNERKKIHNNKLKEDLKILKNETDDKQYSLYLFYTARFSDFVTHMLEIPSLSVKKINKILDELEDQFHPAYPPLSPISDSYYNTWSLFDLKISGEKETLASCFYDCMKLVKGADTLMLRLALNASLSKMEFFEQISTAKPIRAPSLYSVQLKNIYTDEIINLYNNTGFEGEIGYIWYTRVLPSPCGYSYYSSLNTPYIFRNTEKEKLLRFIENTLPKIKPSKTNDSYFELMKFGLNKMFWPTFIFESYSNYDGGAIYLQGTPDDPLSRPHSEESFELSCQ